MSLPDMQASLRSVPGVQVMSLTPEGLLIYRLRTISLSVCFMAAVLALSCKQAAAGFLPAANPALARTPRTPAAGWLAPMPVTTAAGRGGVRL